MSIIPYFGFEYNISVQYNDCQDRIDRKCSAYMPIIEPIKGYQYSFKKNTKKIK